MSGRWSRVWGWIRQRWTLLLRRFGARALPARERAEPPVPAPRGSLCGAARRTFRPELGRGLAGYSALSKRATGRRDELYVRVVYLEDPQGHRIALCTLDLMSASRYLHERVAAITRLGPSGLDVHQIVLAGTHTHTAPAKFYGNSLFDTVAGPVEAQGMDEAFAEGLAELVADAIREAFDVARTAEVAVVTTRLWGASRNRSHAAFPYRDDWAEAGRPGTGAPDGLTPQQRAVDPRVVSLVARDPGGEVIAVFSTFGCHNTALGPAETRYDGDWTRRAAMHAEGLLTPATGGPATGAPATGGRAPIVAVALSSAGDVTPRPPDDGAVRPDEGAGPALADRIGEAVGASIAAACRTGDFAPIQLTTWYQEWEPADTTPIPSPTGEDIELAPWLFGAPTLAGAEDGRSPLFFAGLAWEGMTRSPLSPSDPQYPKEPALGILGNVIEWLGALAPSDMHPLHALRINDFLFVTVPGEPTTACRWELEAVLAATTGCEGVCPIGFAGDYAGYFTTRAEFEKQHYEGAATLYGRNSAAHLKWRFAHLVSGRPFLLPPPASRPFDLGPRRAATPSAVVLGGGSRRGAVVSAWWLCPPGAEVPEVTVFVNDSIVPLMDCDVCQRDFGWHLDTDSEFWAARVTLGSDVEGPLRVEVRAGYIRAIAIDAPGLPRA